MHRYCAAVSTSSQRGAMTGPIRDAGSCFSSAGSTDGATSLDSMATSRCLAEVSLERTSCDALGVSPGVGS
jgi:hypothetical protein